MATGVEQMSNLQVKDRVEQLELIIVASTFMDQGQIFECAMAWNKQENRLLRPVTNFKTNSWKLGTFTVGLTYEFVIRNRNPESDKPHKSEDILVEESHILRDGQLNETAMYEMLESSSKNSVTEIFPADAVKQNKYIEELTDCPSAGILRCKVGDIQLYMDYAKSEPNRCEIFQDYCFPVKAKNRESLKAGLENCRPEDDLLVLLGLARPFAGTEENKFNPRRCYIIVIGIIRAKEENTGQRRKQTKANQKTEVTNPLQPNLK